LPPAAQTIVALQAVHLYTPLSQAIGFGGVFNDLEVSIGFATPLCPTPALDLASVRSKQRLKASPL